MNNFGKPWKGTGAPVHFSETIRDYAVATGIVVIFALFMNAGQLLVSNAGREKFQEMIQSGCYQETLGIKKNRPCTEWPYVSKLKISLWDKLFLSWNGAFVAIGIVATMSLLAKLRDE